MGKREPGLDRDDVRTAVIHLTELAAAFEGRGVSLSDDPKDRDVYERFDWWPPLDRETFDEDEQCLRDVVARLLTHRETQRLRQRNAIIERFLHLLGVLYTASRDGELAEPALQSQLDALCLQFWFQPNADLLRPPEGGGPRAQAKWALELITGLAERTLGGIRAHANPLDDARRPFGRMVPRRTRLTYAIHLHEEILAKTERGPSELWELKQLDETLGLLQDRRVEAWIWSLCVNPELAREMLPPERQLKFDEFVDAIRAEMTGALMDAIRAGDLSRLPEYLRSAAEDYRCARTLDDKHRNDSRDALERMRERAVRELVAARCAQLMVGLVGELDGVPLAIEAAWRLTGTSSE